MEVFRNRGSFLLNQFRVFYREVVRLKRTVEYMAPSQRDGLNGPEGSGSSLAMLSDVLGNSTLSEADAWAGGGIAVLTATAAHPPVPAESSPVRARGNVSTVWQPLLSLLERQGLEAGEAGGSFAFEVYREAQYVMAALADRIKCI